MNILPMPDFGWGPFARLMGMAALIVAIPFTVWAEARVISKFLNLPLGRSLRDATVMNIASGALGFISMGWMVPEIRTDSHSHYYDPTLGQVMLAFLQLMSVPYLISIIVEGLILGLMERNSSRRSIWLISLLSNLASYSGLFVISTVVGFPLFGGPLRR